MRSDEDAAVERRACRTKEEKVLRSMEVARTALPMKWVFFETFYNEIQPRWERERRKGEQSYVKHRPIFVENRY